MIIQRFLMSDQRRKRPVFGGFIEQTHAKTTSLFQIRIYAKYTCVHALIVTEIFHYMSG